MRNTRPSSTSSKKTFLLIQVLRGVAALMVVAHHASILGRERFAGGPFYWKNGAAGVDLFFVISGFVIALSARSLHTGAAAAREFFKRRLERIVPLYWLATTVKILLVIALPAMALHGLGNGWHIVASYLFLPARDALGYVQPVISVGWTLQLELMFYVLFALALFLHRNPFFLLVPALGGLTLLGLFLPQNSVLRVLCNPILLEFLLGIALFRLSERGWRLPPSLCSLALLAGFGTMLALPTGAESAWRPILWGLPAAAIVAAAIGLEPSAQRFVSRWLLALGDASYSIYLTHTLTLPFSAVLLLKLHPALEHARLLGELFGLLLSVGAGILVYRIVELPLIRYFKRRRHVATPPEQVSSSA